MEYCEVSGNCSGLIKCKSGSNIAHDNRSKQVNFRVIQIGYLFYQIDIIEFQ